MKRTIASLATLAVLVSAAAAQTSYPTTPARSNADSVTNSTSTPDMSNTTPSGTNNGNSATTTTTTNDMNTNGSTLPRTASPLPLVSFSAVTALATGLWLKRRRA